MSFQAERESSDAQQALQTFWQKQIQEMRGLGPMHFKSQELPLARIKKIMKVRIPLIYLEKSKREKNEKGLD